MIKVFHSFSSGLTLAMLYVFAVFMTPVFLLLLEVNHVESSPTMFGMPFYIMKIEEYQFSSEYALWMCCLLFSWRRALFLHSICEACGKKAQNIKKSRRNKTSVCLQSE
nr:hypothetical protein P5627_06960 [Bacillus safensis]